jgi:transcriptional regulator with XRE-family HTH domain
MKLTPFGLCVRKIRLELGLTLKEMASAVVVSSAYLSSVELGEKALNNKLVDDIVEYLKEKVSDEKLAEVRAAGAHSMKMVPVSNLDADDRGLVAAFARRLSDGRGVPPDVLKWLRGENGDGGNK